MPKGINTLSKPLELLLNILSVREKHFSIWYDREYSIVLIKYDDFIMSLRLPQGNGAYASRELATEKEIKGGGFSVVVEPTPIRPIQMITEMS